MTPNAVSGAHRGDFMAVPPTEKTIVVQAMNLVPLARGAHRRRTRSARKALAATANRRGADALGGLAREFAKTNP